MNPRYIPANVRLQIFVRDGFSCVYCGAKKSDGHALEVDHVIPVSAGGTAHPDNLVAACQTCNRGKSADLIVPIQDGDPLLPRQAEKSDRDALWQELTRTPKCITGKQTHASLMAEWSRELCLRWTFVEALPPSIDVDWMSEGLPRSWFSPDFRLSGRSGCDIGPSVLVIVEPWLAAGDYTQLSQTRIRNAVISGYKTPTMILCGVPSMFFGILVNYRHKGCPRGRVIDGYLQPTDEWDASGWYPDENGDYQDLREPYRCCPQLLRGRKWDFERECFSGIGCSVNELEVLDGI